MSELGDLMTAGTIIAALAVAWGDMRRALMANRERQDERHTENQLILSEIKAEVKKTNGTVTRHESEIRNLDREVTRLRDDMEGQG